MKECCITQLTQMQELKELGSCLNFLLKASPFIILIPTLGAGVVNEGVRQTAIKQLAKMSMTEAVTKAKGAKKLPDIADTVNSAGKITCYKLSGWASFHMWKHPPGLEQNFWNELRMFYEPKADSAPEPGWFSGWW